MPTCHDCGVEEGKLHHAGCDMERCPFCGGQSISCSCSYKRLGLFDSIKYELETGYLPPDIYNNGLSPEQEKQWKTILEKQGRYPYIVYPVMCARCGALWPDFFSVPDDEWRRYIQPDMRRSVLCRSCYDYIKQVTEEYANLN